MQVVIASAPSDWIVVCELSPREYCWSMTEENKIATDLEDSVMSRLVTLNRRELLDGDFRISETSSNEVRLLEGGESLGVELVLELLKDVRKF